jgi:hypothetical protein
VRLTSAQRALLDGLPVVIPRDTTPAWRAVALLLLRCRLAGLRITVREGRAVPVLVLTEAGRLALARTRAVDSAGQ